MTPAQVGALHAAEDAAAWHAARAEAARQAAANTSPDARAYLIAKADWHQQRANMASKLAREAMGKGQAA